MPLEFFMETDKQYGNGLLLNEHNGVVSIISAGKPRGNGTVYMKWAYPQIGPKPGEPAHTAIPMGVRLGNAREAVKILRFFLKQLGGQDADTI